MEWGTFQSVLQLSVGLNTVYFSFTELRQPIISRETRLLHDLELPLREKLDNPQTTTEAGRLEGDFIQLKVNLNTIVLGSEKFDGVVRFSCLTMALIYWVLLVFASFRPLAKITYPEAVIVSLVGYTSVMLSIVLNVWAGCRIRRSVRRGRTELDRKLVALGSTNRKNEEPLHGQAVRGDAQRMINDTTGTLIKTLESTCPTHLHTRLRDMVQTLDRATNVSQMNKSDWNLRQEGSGGHAWSLDLGSSRRLYFQWNGNTGYATRIHVAV
jgi:plasmid maintenance system killer protein